MKIMPYHFLLLPPFLAALALAFGLALDLGFSFFAGLGCFLTSFFLIAFDFEDFFTSAFLGFSADFGFDLDLASFLGVSGTFFFLEASSLTFCLASLSFCLASSFFLLSASLSSLCFFALLSLYFSFFSLISLLFCSLANFF